MAQVILERMYYISFTVINHADRSIRASYTEGKFTGLIGKNQIEEMCQRIKEEWYLQHMGDANFVPVTPTDPNDPLADLTLVITGMHLLELDKDNKPYPWVNEAFKGE